MAFSESWVETDPDGAVITGSLLDDYQRQAKRAIRERLEGDPANMNSGIFESGTFGGTAIVRAGTARAYAVAAAGLGALTLQDGRIAITTDTNRLYHLKGSGMVEIGYAPIAGGAFNFAVAKLTSGATSTFGASLGAASFQLYADPVYGAVVAGFGTTSDVALAARDGSIILRSGPGSVNIVTGGAMTINGLLTVNSTASITGGNMAVSGSANPYLNLNDGVAPSYVQVVGGAINLSSRNGQHTISGTLTVLSTLTISAGGLTVSAGTTAVQALTATTGAFSGAVSGATTYQIGAAGGLLRTGNYTQLVDSDVAATIQAGNVATGGLNLYDNTQHQFRARGGGTTFVTISSSGLTVSAGEAAAAALTVTTAHANTGASKGVFDFSAGAARFFAYGADAVTTGTMQFWLRRSDGTGSVTWLSTDTTGAASFAKGVTISSGGLTVSAGGIVTGGNVRIPHSSNYAARNNAGTGDINLIGTVAGVDWIVIGPDAASQIIIGNSAGTKLGFYNSAPIALQNVSGSRGGNVALANLFTALQNLGLLVDMTTV